MRGMAREPLNIAGNFPPVSESDWRAKVETDLGRASFESLQSGLPGGLRLEPLYTAGESPDEAAVGFPGLPPFVRGRSASDGGWKITQEYDDPRMDVCGAAIAADLARGAEGVWLRAGTEHGTRLLTAGDLDVVLKGVDLAETPVFLEPRSDVLSVGASFIALARARGVDLKKLSGGFGADPYGTLACMGTLPAGFEGAYRALSEVAAYSAKHTPSMRACLATSAPYHDAGASAVQELAWTLAKAISYLRQMVDQGELDVDAAANEILFAFPISGDFFSEIAKLRAARLLWSKVVAASGGGASAQAMRIHARTSRFTKTQRDPWVNMLRTTTEAFAAAVGGADTIATSPFDEAVGPSDDFSRRVARNVQVVLREEAHLDAVVDPAGGSYFLRALTDDLARAAWAELQVVEQGGGLGKAIARGHIARALESTSAERREAIARRRTSIVGVSEFANLEESRLERAPVDMGDVEVELGNDLGSPDAEARYEGMESFKKTESSMSTDVGDVFAAAVEVTGLGADFISIGKMLAEGRPEVHAEPLAAWRIADAWEALRDTADAAAAKGKAPRAFLANLGPIPEHKPCSAWSANLLAAGGIASGANDGFADVDSALSAYSEDGAPLAVIVGTDARYAEIAADLARGLKAKGASVVLLAGKPGDAEEGYRQAGIDCFAHAGADAIELLSTLHRLMGVSS